MTGKIKWILFLILSLSIVTATAQEYNYARLSLLYGGNIPFNFNTIQKVSNGIEIQDGTVLGITLADSSQFGTVLQGFDLTFKTFNGATVIDGEVADLDLDKIRVRADNNLGLASGSSFGYQDLSINSTTLFSYTEVPFSDLTWVLHQLSISYECGKPDPPGNGSLLGSVPGFYTVEIEIELIPIGVGF